MHLPEVNVWLALAFEVHAFHSMAKAWFEEVHAQSCAFCRQTQLGFLRLATNPSVFKGEALTMEKAWMCFDLLVEDERVLFLDEPALVESNWRELTSTSSYSHKVWNDAFLAAFAQQANLELVTFDKGFAAQSKAKIKVL